LHAANPVAVGVIIERLSPQDRSKIPLAPLPNSGNLTSATVTIWRKRPARRQALQLAPMKGEIPSPINPPPGCAFNPRCPFVFEPCRKLVPELIDGVACYAGQQGRSTDVQQTASAG
jgi:oligopeptide/dipeptide ABC transporter ATP-binding protein